MDKWVINSKIQSIRSKYDYIVKEELKKPRPNYKTPAATIKLLTAIIKRGPVTTDIATIREAINSATKNRFDRLSHFPFPFPVFRTLQLRNIADERVIFVPDDSERIDSLFICVCDKCDKRTNSNNQVHQKKRICLDSENTGHSLATQATQIFDNYPELPSLLIDPNLSYKIQFNNQLDRYQKLFNPSTTAERKIPAPFSTDNFASTVHSAADERLCFVQGIPVSRGAQQELGDESSIPSEVHRRNHKRGGFVDHSTEGNNRPVKRRPDRSESLNRGIFKSEEPNRPTASKPIDICKQEEHCIGKYPENNHRNTANRKMADDKYRNSFRPTVHRGAAREFSAGDRNGRRNEKINYDADDDQWRKGKFTHSRRSSDTPSSDSDADSFYVEYQPSDEPTNGNKPKRYHNTSPIRRNLPKKENDGKEVRTFSDTHKGRGAITMLNQIQNYTGSPAVRFDRWIKLFDNVVVMSNWNNSDIVNMLSTKMSGEAYDFLQNIMESDTIDYNKIKALFQENFHGDEDADFYQEKFDEMQRKPKENILNYAFRLKTIYQRAYPSNKLETQDEKSSQLQFLRQKFLQGLEPELQHIIRYKKVLSFQELVAITQKYAKRVQLEQNDKEKTVFVNAVSTNQNDSLLIKAIEKQKNSINAIATSLKFGNKPAESTTFQNSATVNSNFSQQMEQLTESMINLGELINSSILKDILRNHQRGEQSNGYNQQNQSSFFNPAPQNNFSKSRPSNRFQQPPSGPPAKPLILPVNTFLFHFHILRNQICLSSNLPHLPTIRPHSFTNFRNRSSRQLSTRPIKYLKNLIRRQNSVVKGDFAILVVNGVMKSKTVLSEYPCSDITKEN
ncbi:hypothetical protein DAPPUDRAFT_116869 [Daphnia pulex]|uniref:Retrotransposon gag domain-containing protein n=1 Tax=Daphnia pulex TaxID=6669 RepID=E9HQT6_DAPPU|nr:hypothetical protein DAPPUDRAFT_116869 [Daphnia pulex]|eukprot:EFX65897.1 hypothetical protein DAPPUDRAFT_116869 [Daphnia pulex]